MARSSVASRGRANGGLQRDSHLIGCAKTSARLACKGAGNDVLERSRRLRQQVVERGNALLKHSRKYLSIVLAGKEPLADGCQTILNGGPGNRIDDMGGQRSGAAGRCLAAHYHSDNVAGCREGTGSDRVLQPQGAGPCSGNGGPRHMTRSDVTSQMT